jgi:hypothetical protein
VPLQHGGRPADQPRIAAVLFTATSFLSAFLLFLVQPMVAKLVLPPYGGSASVWNTTNAFFQATLLAGYAYSHVLSTRVPRRRQAPLHAVALLLPLATLPLALPAWAAPPEDRPPALWLLLVLVVAIGAPFLAVSTTGPLLQRWFSFTDHRRADDPYYLYAAGNVGSFLALLAYPVVLEAHWAVDDQARIWAGGYVGLVLLVGTCGFVARRRAVDRADGTAPDAAAEPAPPPTRADRLRWLVLAAVPSTLMLGVTSFITADLAAVPMLWVLPLAAYLATFVVAFGRPGRDEPRTAAAVLVVALVAVGALVAGDLDTVPLVVAVGLHLLLFTVGAYVAHRRLALRRPGPEHLTGFYLVVALGGVLGGSWNAFVAPLVFNRVVEYPLAILAVAVLGLAPLGEAVPPLRQRYGRFGTAVEVGLGFAATFAVAELLDGRREVLAVGGLAALGLVAFLARRAVPALAVGAAALVVVQILAPLPNDPALESRTFFGVYRVDRFPDHVELISGSTSHGAQDPSRPHEPLSYYTRGGPVGQVMATYGPGADEVGLVGLGVGALAAYGRAGQRFTFYEIDPEVVRIARDTGWFTYLTDTPATVDYRVGDGRLELADTDDRTYDVLVLDAFSGDAIPVHLLTAEAFALYRTRLADGGVIAVHISNRYLDLRPVVAGAAEADGLTALVRRDGHAAGAGTSGSWWMVAPLAADDRWHPGDEAGTVDWTDQRSNILEVLGVGGYDTGDG